MSKKIGTIAALLFLAFLLIPRSHPGQKPAPITEQSVTPEQEIHMKQSLVSQDVAATNDLCRRQCTLDFQQSIQQVGNHADDGQIRALLKALQTEHPHMTRLIWTKRGMELNRGIAAGNWPEGLESAAGNALKEAKQSADAGKQYESPPIQTSSGTYFVMGVPSIDGNSSLVGLIHQRILAQVEDHQKKNLRVVPFPAEGHWKIESVDSKTLKDIHVNHPEENEGASHYHKNQVVVKFSSPPSEEQLRQIREELGAGPVQKLGYTYVFESSHMEAKEMMNYFKKWNVEYAEPHFLYITNNTPDASRQNDGNTTNESAAFQAPNDVLYARYQWNLPIIETEKGWGIGRGNQNVIVGVVDTGVDLNHPDLKGHLLEGTNVVSEGNSAPNDDVGHGTHVAGVISALVNNGEGVAGMSWFNPILPVKVLDSSGSGSTYAVAQGVIWAADHGAKVINLSLGNYADAQFLHDAIRYAYNKDVVIIAAAGNDNTERPSYPAAYPEVFAVAATDANKNKASFSNYGDHIAVSAPGVSIASTYPNNQYAALSGTSMASPHVSALAALIRSANPDLKNTDVMDIMRRSAMDIGPSGKDKYYGFGQIDVVKALRMARQNSTPISSLPAWLQNEFQRIAAKYGAR